MNPKTREDLQRDAAKDVRDAAKVLEAALNTAERTGVIVSCQVENSTLLSIGEEPTTLHRIRVATTVAI